MYKHLYPEWVGESSALTSTVTDNSGAIVPGKPVRSDPRENRFRLAKAPGGLGLSKELV